MEGKRKKNAEACDFCRGQKKRCDKVGNSCVKCRKRRIDCTYSRNSSKRHCQGDPSHNCNFQLRANELPEFLSAGDSDDLDGAPEFTYLDGDILQAHSNFDLHGSPEFTHMDGDILQTDFNESPKLASVEIDVQHFQNGIGLSTNADGHQSEIFPGNLYESYDFVNNFHKTNTPQALIKQSVCKASQIIQQLSCLDLILSENQNLQPQISSSLRDLSDLNKILDLYSSQFHQLLNELQESNSTNTNALQEDEVLEPRMASSINQSSDIGQCWNTSQSLTDRAMNINIQGDHQTAPTNQHSFSGF
ncbi:transcription factor predicted [Gigaspora margarita]|uniref:Transcription factor predicted n=1 Tax=Gigaspora margarita TaxID=4874 RepID=A0A8H3XLX5_GIGMA|nr:transcription factor predicted [Gigaspora margarita]